MRLLRDNRGLSLRQLDERTNISFSQLSQMERGYHVPTDKELERICIALEVTPEMVYPDANLRKALAE